MNQDHLMQSGLKDQQDWIFKDKLRFGGVGAINILNWWLSQRLCMFVAIITYLVIITRVLRNNHIKTRWFNWLLWGSLWWRWWCCWWKWKRPGCHHRCQIGGVKYTIHRSKSSLCPFIIFANNPSWWFEETMKNQTIQKKAENIHHHRVCYSDHGLVPQYHFSKLQRWTAHTYLLPVSGQYLWLGFYWCFT